MEDKKAGRGAAMRTSQGHLTHKGSQGGTASAKVLRRDCAWTVQEKQGRPPTQNRTWRCKQSPKRTVRLGASRRQGGRYWHRRSRWAAWQGL